MKGRNAPPGRSDGWEDSVVPLSEQLNAMFAGPAAKDNDGELLGFEGSFAAPRGKMTDAIIGESEPVSCRIFFFFFFKKEDDSFPVGKKAKLRIFPEIESKYEAKKSSRSELLGDNVDEEEDSDELRFEGEEFDLLAF
jgi:hypothetical protein